MCQLTPAYTPYMAGDVRSAHYVIAIKRFLLNLAQSPSAFSHRIKPREKADSKLVFILSFPRSGTTALASILTQPELGLDYHGEFFAFNAWTRMNERINKFYPFFTTRYHRNFVKQKRHWKTYRYESSTLNPRSTIKAWKQISGTHIFKIFPKHITDIHLEEIIKEFRPTVIFLRRNHLDRIISNKKANQSGTWHHVKTEHQRVTIDPRELESTQKDHEAFYKKFKTLAIENELVCLDFNYREIFTEQNVRKILNEICVGEAASKASYSPSTTKQDSSSTNQEDFLKKLASLGIKRTISDYDFEMFEVRHEG